MIRARNAILALLACLPAWGVTCPSGYSYYASFTIPSSEVSGSSDLSSFPVLISGTFSDLATVANGGKVQNTATQSGGGASITVPADLVFKDASGTLLNWEFESYTASSGAVIVWVQIGTLSHSTSTIIYAFYDDSSVTTWQGNVNGTWDSNFKLVSHLPNGSTLTVADSTSSANSGTNTGATAVAGPTYTDGAAAFNGSSEYVDFGNASSLQITSNLTIEHWFLVTAWPGNGDQEPMFGKGYDGGANSYGFITRTKYTGAFGNELDCIANVSGTDHGTNGVTSISTGTWHHLACTFDGSNWKIYLDGSSFASTADSTAPQGTNSSHIVAGALGNAGGTPFFDFDGDLDELRISNTNRSAGWIGTEYTNESAPSSFYSTSFTNACAGGTPYTASTADALRLLDSPTGLGAHFPSVLDRLVLSDSGAELAAHKPSAVDAVVVLIVASGLGSHFETPADSVRIGDSSSGLGSHFGSAHEAVRLGESAVELAGHFGTSSELFRASDIALEAAAHFGLQIEHLRTGDLGAGTASHFGAVSDILALRESGAEVASHFGSASDLLAIIDSSIGSAGHSRTYSDLIPLADIAARLSAHFPATSESIGPYDAAAEVAAHFGKPSEIFILTDSGIGLKVKLVLVSDSLRFVDSAGSLAAHLAAPADFISAIDSPLRMAALHVTPSDGFGFGDSQARILGRAVSGMDYLSLVDSPQRRAALERVNADSSFVIDLACCLGSHFPGFSESLPFSDFTATIHGGGGGSHAYMVLTFEVTPTAQIAASLRESWNPIVYKGWTYTPAQRSGTYIVKTENGIYIVKITRWIF